MQTDNRVLDSMARFFTNAAGAAQAFRTEVENIVKSRLEKMVGDLDFVPREEFDAVKLMAAKAREENERLAARIVALEGKRDAKPSQSSPRPKRVDAKKRSKGKL